MLDIVSCRSLNCTTAQLQSPDRLVIFTFDDGPNADHDTTARLLDVLQKYHIHAVFALLGENAEHSPDLVRRIRDEGHTIINHGYSDKWAYCMNAKEFKVNLERGEQVLTAILDAPLSPRLYRPQGGFYTAAQQAIWEKAGWTMVKGTARPYDAVMSAAEKDTAVQRVIATVEKQHGGVILLHDGRDSYKRIEANLAKKPNGEFNREWIPDAVEEIIVMLLKNGYRIGEYSDLMP
jgi:peptidoglycan/xylan/chitin deacetylase (PgdA/CDA1 family)